MYRIIKTLLFLLFPLFVFAAESEITVIEPSDVVNVQALDSRRYVSDMAGVLSSGVRSHIDSACVSLRASTDIEMAVVIVPSIGDADEYDFAYELFNLWHIGSSETNSGLLWLYVVDIRAMKFETGLGVEGIFTDAWLNRLLDEQIFPLMREGRTDEAFLLGISEICTRSDSDEVRAELMRSSVSERALPLNLLIWYLIFCCVALIILSSVFYIRCTRLSGNNAERYKSLSPTLRIAKIFAFIMPLPVYFLYRYMRRVRNAQRVMPVSCSCGTKMRLLSEAEEDAFLSSRQQAEENIQSIDYDVWICPECGETKILKYDGNRAALYKKCPACGAHVYHMVRDHIVFPPTPLTPGKGEKIWRCDVCGAVRRVSYIIPPVPVITGGRSGNSGGFGGGFGGGFSGGGGAGGHF